MKRIILADNQSLFLAGTVKLLSAEDDMRIVALSTDNEHLLRAVKAFRSSIVLVASSLKPNLHELASSIRATRGRLIVIAGNTESAKGYATNEVSGVVFRMTTGQELVTCIRAVAAGGVYRQKKSQSHHAVEIEPDWVGERVRNSLTRRELMVVGLGLPGTFCTS